MSADSFHLLVALPAEARPLIRAFGLKRQQPDGAFPRYAGGCLNLVLTGPGRQAAADAAEFLHALNPDQSGHWINLGIAGHSHLEPGSLMVAERITDRCSGREWQLQPLRNPANSAITPLHCVDEAETRYAEAGGYDMESAGIAARLDEFGLLAQLQVIKVISDNPRHPSRRINARMVGELMQRQLPALETLIDRLNPHA